MFESIKMQVLDYAKRSYAGGLFAGTSGNLSLFDGGIMAITPSSLSYEAMKMDDIVVMELSGKIIKGERKPSSEWKMHAEIYKAMPDVHAVIHTHSPYATAISAAGGEIPVFLIEAAAYFGCSPVKTAPFEIPGSAELGLSAVPFLQKSGACLLANHGVVTCGENLAKAHIKAVYTEDAAKIYCITKSIGEVRTISEENIKIMKETFGW